MEKNLQRTRLLIGSEGIYKLKQAKIAVIGLGGVGSFAAEAIARSGIGYLTIVDPDRIEPTNINRQLPALFSTVEQYKTEVMAGRILDINPSIVLNKITGAYTSENSHTIIDSTFNYVIDAIDSLPDKIHLIKTCLEKHIPIVSSMGTANRLDPLMLKVDDISATSICPMARKVRRELHKYNINSGFKVVYSRENPRKITPNADTKLGSISYVPPVAGFILASVAINDILTNK